MDELLNELRRYLADAPKREKIAEDQHRELLRGLASIAKVIQEGCQTISNTIIDMSRENARR